MGDQERVDWMLGKGNKEVQAIAKKAGLAYLRWTGTALELCGGKRSIEDAIMLLDSHNEYFHVYEEMNRQNQEIEKSFEALDEAAESAGLTVRRRAPSRPRTRGGAAPTGGRGRGRGYQSRGG